MKQRKINFLGRFLLALALPAIAIGTGLQSCSEEGPSLPGEKSVKLSQGDNLLMRSPEEAIDIAQRAWEEFYGNASPESRSGRSIIDYGRPVEKVPGFDLWMEYQWLLQGDHRGRTEWYGEKNGWFNQAVVVLSHIGSEQDETRTFENFKYVMIN